MRGARTARLDVATVGTMRTPSSAMKIDFVQPRFVGARFEGATLPLDVLPDLLAYRALVVDVAGHLFRQDHPGRERLPKGFDDSFRLDLVGVAPGSARAVLSVVAAGALGMDTVEGGWFARARDLVAECIAAPDGAWPQEFPRKSFEHFNRVGRSLRDGERMELTRRNGGSAVLTPSRRKTLVLAESRVYERSEEWEGTIDEVDWTNRTCRLKRAQGGAVRIPMRADDESDIRRCAGRAQHRVKVRVSGTFDAMDKLAQVVGLESFAVQWNAALADQFDVLGALDDGWLEGRGKALDREHLEDVASRITRDHPDDVEPPTVAPTPEGNLLFEWRAAGDPSVDLDLVTRRAEFHAFDAAGHDITQAFTLDRDEAWSEFFAFVRTNVMGGGR